jgi:mediator of RNA polymerase II transcription subunit 14
MAPAEIPTAVAGPSKPPQNSNNSNSNNSPPSRNPQLGPEPWFAYLPPSDDDLEDELPPYFEGENVPMGPALERLVRKGHGDMRVLLGETWVAFRILNDGGPMLAKLKLTSTRLPPLSARHKSRPVIEYAKHTRQAVLKYLAVLRWKTAVDVAHPVKPESGASASDHTSPQNTNGNGQTSFPTPHSNGSNDSPGGYVGKGKGRMMDDNGASSGITSTTRTALRGKVTDAKRIQHFMQHQNKQHEDAVAHVRHTAKVVEGLR